MSIQTNFLGRRGSLFSFTVVIFVALCPKCLMRNLLDRGDSHTPSGKVAQLKTTTQSLPYLITTHRGRAFEHVNKNFRSSIAKNFENGRCC